MGETRQASLTPKAKRFYSKLVASYKKIKNNQRQITSYKQRLANATTFLEGKLNKLLDYVNEPTYRFISCQIRNQKLKPRGRRFTMEEKILAITLLKASGKGYRLLSKMFALPSKKTCLNLLNKLPILPGINEKMFEVLRDSVAKMKPHERYCALVFDEMAISTNLQFNKKYDFIEGLEDFGDSRNAALADHANVFLIKGILRRWKQPIAFTFSNGPTKTFILKQQIISLIEKCQKIGLKVIFTICDQGAGNQAAINSLLKDTVDNCKKNNEECRYHGFLINGEEIVPVYDIPHLFKGIRNNLLTKDLHIKINGETKIAKWDHIVQFYLLDLEDDLRICHKLTDQHVLKTKINKMKVKNCTQVFSFKVGSLMSRIAKWGKFVIN